MIGDEAYDCLKGVFTTLHSAAYSCGPALRGATRIANILIAVPWPGRSLRLHPTVHNTALGKEQHIVLAHADLVIYQPSVPWPESADLWWWDAPFKDAVILFREQWRYRRRHLCFNPDQELPNLALEDSMITMLAGSDSGDDVPMDIDAVEGDVEPSGGTSEEFTVTAQNATSVGDVLTTEGQSDAA